MKHSWKVYLVRCSDNSLYCGIAKDVEKRIGKHNEGKGAKYTRFRRPVKMVAISNEMTKGEALSFEYFIKQLPAHKKIDAFMDENYRKKNLKTELHSIVNEIKQLQAKLERVINAVEKQ